MRAILRGLVVTGLLFGGAIFGLRLAFPLPDISQRAPDVAIPADPARGLGMRFAQAAARFPAKTGVLPLIDGREALGSRLFLASRAEVSIDAQYYIWHDDVSGRLLLKALHDAALRGVRVRLLLDDNGIDGMDPYLAGLNALPNFEVRLFNPSTIRTPKTLGYTFSFARMNRRMHNKAFIVDGAAAIVGGRNIGDVYFQIGAGSSYVDADVLGIGAVVPETQAAFDAYWNSASAYELERLVAGPGDRPGLLAAAAEAARTDAAAEFRAAMAVIGQRVADEGRSLEWTDVAILVDDPAKGLGQADPDQLLIARLKEKLGAVEQRLDLVSAYFVPGRNGTAFLADLATAGHRVRIETNALETTDVLVVHAGYSKHRRELLEAGVRLWELKPRADAPAEEAGVGLFGSLGVSGTSLHAKTFAIDGAQVFIGSFNFDPRSARLNCEMGFLIDSPAMAAALHRHFDAELPAISYRPELTADGRMVWQENLPDGTVVTHEREPGVSWLKRLAIVAIAVLPLEWML